MRRARLLTAYFAALFTMIVVSSASGGGNGPVVTIDTGAVRGLAANGGYEFRGLPYAAPPTGALRWRPPQPAASWKGVRDATTFAPSCPQVPTADRGAGAFLRGLPLPQRVHADAGKRGATGR